MGYRRYNAHPAMKILDLTPEDHRAIEQVAALLVDGFRDSGSQASVARGVPLGDEGYFRPRQ